MAAMRQRSRGGRVRLEDVAALHYSTWKERRLRKRAKSLRLVDYVHHVSPELQPPEHLRPYAEVLEKACPGNTACDLGSLRAVVAAPPQHGKTELALRAFLWWDSCFPGKRHAYVTYNGDRAMAVARRFWDVAEQAGLEPGGTLEEVRLKGGSTIKFTSIGGSLTGYPIDGVCIVDDPIKDSTDAQSATLRKRCVEWFDSVAFARRHPGTSFVVMATRWHVEDLSGVLVKREGWRYVNLKAIADGPVNDDGVVIDDPLGRRAGESLWPAHKPPSFFNEERLNAYWWASLYQGEPRPRGGHVFNEPARYDALPTGAVRIGHGCDLAFSAKTHRDWSVAIELWREDPTDGSLPIYYLVEVDRRQVQAPEFCDALAAKLQNTGSVVRWYAYGSEIGIADFIRREGVLIQSISARGDKFARATPVAAAWNAGRVKVPRNAPWLSVFLDEVREFTGIDDLHDDQVDALGAAYDLLNEAGSFQTYGGSGSRYSTQGGSGSRYAR